MGNHATTNFFGDELVTYPSFDTVTEHATNNNSWIDDTLDGSQEAELTQNTSSGNARTGSNSGAVAMEATTCYLSYRKTDLTAGKTYYSEIYIKSGSGSGTGRMVIGTASRGEQVSPSEAPAVDFNTSGWSKIYATWVASQAEQFITIIFTNVANAETHYIDDFSLKEVGISSSGFATADSEPTIPQVPLLRYNEKMVFDGIDDVVTTANNIGISGSPKFTMACWFRIDKNNEYPMLMSSGAITGHNENSLYVNGSSGAYELGWGNQHGDGDFTNASGSAIESDTLYHGAVTFNGSNTIKIYVNGILDGTKSDVSNVNITDSVLYIGKRANGLFLDGLVDEACVFNDELSATEVQELFNDGVALDANSHSKKDNLLGYWRNDGVNSWIDRTNIKAISFDGTDDKIAIDGVVNDINTQTGTINIWCMPITGSAGTDVVFSYNDNNARSDMMFRYNWDHNRIEAGLAQSGSQKWYTYSGTNSVSSHLNSWNMITLVHDGSAPICYVNGVDIEWTVAGTDHTFWFGDMSGVDKCAFGLWQYTSDDNEFLGYIGRSAVWDTNLSASQISAIYALGRHGDLTASYSSNLKGFYLMDKDHATPDATGSNGIIDRSGTANHGTITGATFLGTNNGTPAGTPESIVVREGLNSNKDGLGFPFNTDTRDCLRLDGASEYLTVPDTKSLRITGGLTVEAWVKTTDNGCYIVGRDDNSDRSFYLAIIGNKARLFVTDGSSTAYDDGATSVNDDNWHHLVGVYVPSTSITIYVDGSSDGVNTSSIVSSLNSASEPVIIGSKGNFSSTELFHGLIDEVRIYNKALSATEVSKNYKHGKGKHKNS